MFMTHATAPPASITYRATGRDGAEVELRLVMDPRAATAADAWARLTALHGPLDPLSLEIEIRKHARA